MKGSEWGPVALPVFKTGRRPHLCGWAEFDSQALPPILSARYAGELGALARFSFG
jgi:hypothetical protein